MGVMAETVKEGKRESKATQGQWEHQETQKMGFLEHKDCEETKETQGLTDLRVYQEHQVVYYDFLSLLLLIKTYLTNLGIEMYRIFKAEV